MSAGYALSLFVVLIITIFLDWKFKIALFGNFKKGIIVFAIFFIVGVIWEGIALKYNWWIYPEGFPIEELLFHLIVPYFILIVYRIVEDRIANEA